MKKLSLQLKTALILVVFAVLIISVACISVVYRIKQHAVEEATLQAIDYTYLIADFVDGDRIEGYLETLQKDEYYEQVQKFLNACQTNSSLEYCYVYVPNEEDLVYIWDADGNGKACDLGEHEQYMEDGYKATCMAIAAGKESEYAFGVQTKDETYGYIVSMIIPIYNSEGDTVAIAGADASVPEVTDSIKQFLRVVALNIALVVLVCSVGFFFVVRRKLVRPIGMLNQAAGEIVNNLESGGEVSFNIHSGDEIEGLARSFEKMYGEVRDYIERLSEITVEKERIGIELSVAKEIQASMLPSIFPAFPERTDVDIYATMDPAKEVGGDFYDFFLIDPQHLGIVIADVSGKGIPAALFMMISKTMIKNRTLTGGTPAEVLAFVNNELYENNKAEMFVTAWLGILDLESGTLTAANAGHEYPVLRRKGGVYEPIRDPHGLVLAVMGNMQYVDYEISLSPGDMLYIYTDGVTEATNEQDELYSEQRMVEALNRHTEENCEQLLHAMSKELQDFVKDAPQFDDITMLALTYYGQ